MATLHLWVLLSAVFTAVLWRWVLPRRQGDSPAIGKFTVPLLFLLALTARILLAAKNTGFGVDISCFSSWSERMADLGPSRFYARDYFSDYPPLYLYVLWLIGLIRRGLSAELFSPVHLVLLKLPSILADLGIGYLLFYTCRRHLGMVSALALSALYLFQPVVLMNSCLWGQIDSVFTFILLLVCIFLEKDQVLPAYLLYGMGVLLKPQMLIFAPLLMVSMLQYVLRPAFSSRRLLKSAGYACLSLVLAVLAASPFGLDKVLPQYTDTLASYPYASVNAYNFWAAAGLNWGSQNTVFCGFRCISWGYLAIALAVIFCMVIGFRFRNIPGRYGLMGAFLIITVFTFSVRMHERYLYPMMGLLLLAFPGLAAGQLHGGSPGRHKRLLTLTPHLRYGFTGLFTLMTCLHLYNTGHVLYFYDPQSYSATAPILCFSGAGMTVCALLFYVLLNFLSKNKEGAYVSETDTAKLPRFQCPEISASQRRITKRDILLLCLVTFFYSLFALRDLGDAKAPETVYSMSREQSLYFVFPEDHKAAYLSYYIAPEHGRSFLFQFSGGQESGGASPCEEYVLKNVFTWDTLAFPVQSSFILAQLRDSTANLIEFVFLDADGNPVQPLNASSYPELFDEASLYPETFSFRNSMYFDEIYHARTAYEFLHEMRSYENTHPPLGKILISLGVLIFGMNPFGWRIVGTVFGIAMLPVLYLFAKRLTGNTAVSALTCWIFAFDFMHFAQTRLATIDVFIVFFIICMYYFLYRFFTVDYWDRESFGKLCLPLACCGLSMGLGVACKWTGVYAGIGMGILFFAYLALHRKSYLSAKQNPSGKTGTHSNWDILSVFPDRTFKIIVFCLFFFVLLPGLIYLLSYLPFRESDPSTGLFARMLKNQETMYSYHSTLNETHYFASPYYEWPLIIRPIWYYSGVLSPTLREGISSFGNPLVWWAGIPVFFFQLWLYLKKKDKNALFLLTGYLAQYVPWFFVTRITFIYHYFPSVVFVVLMIGYSFRCLIQNLPRKRVLIIMLLYAAAVFGLFLLFYPVLAGQPVEIAFVNKFLRWFKTWVLISQN